MAGEMEYYYAVMSLAICLPVAVHYGMVWLRASHVRENYFLWSEMTLRSLEREQARRWNFYREFWPNLWRWANDG